MFRCFDIGLFRYSFTTGCTFRTGFGTTGGAKYMGIKANAAECNKTCSERKRNTIGNINGAIVSTASVVNVHCYCALGMTGNNGIKYWKTCIFNRGRIILLYTL